MQTITYVGLDVHKATISVAAADSGRGSELRHIGVFPNRPDLIAKLVERLHKRSRRLSFCYEAGPCGYGLYRQLSALGHECVVVAPSLIPIKAGDRVKTDRRDAIILANLHRISAAPWTHLSGQEGQAPTGVGWPKFGSIILRNNWFSRTTSMPSKIWKRGMRD